MRRLAEAVAEPPVYVTYVEGDPRPVWLHINDMQHHAELSVERAVELLQELAEVLGQTIFDPSVHQVIRP
ncbi:hypothetical protein CP973_00360 [Streptomyces albofaciens JCM 4342]|uniref:hypothetical protein n=1 Tax=Streptomyces albofaciens TaxID=66866 RepID=UPI001238FFFC|nr:hypothetical protein [Streptomyces albofaciens]KAA6220610.1 hypothetical protein CP973_00115 [Streptomyces albofaciens JCM 4342]KAA6220653.1 hypothetical protein CP973_00360 [Streptomyces albofaciens JCM 4342]